MRQRLALLGMMVLMAAVLMAAPASAASYTAWLSAGAIIEEGSSLASYAYGEFAVQDDLAVGLEVTGGRWTLGAWFGQGRGVYAETTLQGGTPSSWELGLWASTYFAETEVSGWAGLSSAFGNFAHLHVTIGAEAYVPIQAPFYLVVGGETILTGDNHPFTFRVGPGIMF